MIAGQSGETPNGSGIAKKAAMSAAAPRTAPLPPSFAQIPQSTVLALPHYGGNGCQTLSIVPTDYVGGKVIDPPPADFNPRPTSTPGIPTSGTWTPYMHRGMPAIC